MIVSHHFFILHLFIFCVLFFKYLFLFFAFVFLRFVFFVCLCVCVFAFLRFLMLCVFSFLCFFSFFILLESRFYFSCFWKTVFCPQKRCQKHNFYEKYAPKSIIFTVCFHFYIFSKKHKIIMWTSEKDHNVNKNICFLENFAVFMKIPLMLFAEAF